MKSFDLAKARYKAGVMNPQAAQRLVEGYAAQTQHPGELAAANKAGYVAGVVAKQDVWARHVATKHSLPDLINRMKTKGSGAYTAAASTASESYAKDTGTWYGILQGIVQTVNQQIPRGPGKGRQREQLYAQLVDAAKATYLSGGGY